MKPARTYRNRRTRLPGRARAVASLAGLLLAWSGAEPWAAPAWAQVAEQPAVAQEAPDQPPAPKTYLNKGTIQLPIQIDERARGQVQEIRLFVKSGPTAPWQQYTKAGWGQNAFTFNAQRDGEYWFAMVTVDQQGRTSPSDLTREPPGLIIVVDRAAPQVELFAVGTGPDGQMVQCEAKDDHLDPLKTRVMYQTGDRVFRPLDPMQGRPNTYCVPSQAVVTGLLRVSATDLAGNVTSREVHINQLPPAGTTVAAAAAPRASAPSEPKRLPQSIVPPAEETSTESGPVIPNVPHESLGSAQTTARKVAPQPQPQPQPTTPPSVPAQASVADGGPAIPQTSVAPEQVVRGSADQVAPRATPPVIPPRRETVTQAQQIINSPHVYLEYQIEQAGASGIGRVEVYMTQDQGQSWKRLAEDGDKKSPAEFDLPGEGLFGVSLVISNGRGFGGTPPAQGETPQWCIEVDTTRPEVQITNVRTIAEGGGAVDISWRASDKNMAADGIDVYYASSRQGPWKAVARGLRNDGNYRWMPPSDVGTQAYLRVSARDQAGNSNIVETTQPVLLDDGARPRAQILGASTHVPAKTSGGTQGN